MTLVFRTTIAAFALLSSVSGSAAEWAYLGRSEDGIVFIAPRTVVTERSGKRPRVTRLRYIGFFVKRWKMMYDVPEIRYASYVVIVDTDCLTGKSRVADTQKSWSADGEVPPTIIDKNDPTTYHVSSSDGRFGAVFNSPCRANLKTLSPVTRPNHIGAAMLRHGAKTVAELPMYEIRGDKYAKDCLPGGCGIQVHPALGL